jgi:hypothetical protein
MFLPPTSPYPLLEKGEGADQTPFPVASYGLR